MYFLGPWEPLNDKCNKKKKREEEENGHTPRRLLATKSPVECSLPAGRGSTESLEFSSDGGSWPKGMVPVSTAMSPYRGSEAWEVYAVPDTRTRFFKASSFLRRRSADRPTAKVEDERSAETALGVFLSATAALA